jgi:hypothetical protein
MKICWIIGIVLLMSACNSPQEKLIADIRGYLPKDNGIYAVAYLDKLHLLFIRTMVSL